LNELSLRKGKRVRKTWFGEMFYKK
jgi:hypothetical protein